PAMSYAILSVLWERLGETKKAFQLFRKSYRPNRVPPFGVLAETAGGTNPYFATGAGGVLQSVLFGFGGLEIAPHGIKKHKSKLPNDWNSLLLKNIGSNRKNFRITR